MATNAELAKENRELKEQLEKNAAALAAIEERLNAVEKQPAERITIPDKEAKEYRREDHPEPGGGWMIIVNPIDRVDERGNVKKVLYNGITAGVKFVNGRALIDEDMPGSDEKVRQLVGDFGYGVQALSAAELYNWRKRIAMEPVVDDRTPGEKLVRPAAV